VETQDTLLTNAQNNPTSKLYPATNPTRIRRISSPRKLTKKSSQKTSPKKHLQHLTKKMMMRIFLKVTRNHAKIA